MGIADWVIEALGGGKKVGKTTAEMAAESRRNNTTFDMLSGKQSSSVRVRGRQPKSSGEAPIADLTPQERMDAELVRRVSAPTMNEKKWLQNWSAMDQETRDLNLSDAQILMGPKDWAALVKQLSFMVDPEYRGY